MKKTVAMLAVSLVATTGVFAQGTVEFDNLIAGNPATSPRIFAPDGVTGLNDGYRAELLGGADAGSLAVLGSALSFFSTASGGAGFVNTASGVGGALRTVTGVGAGQVATFQVRAWRLSDGATYSAALAAGGQVGMSALFTQSLGGSPVGAPPITPPKLTNLQSFSLVPEPSVVALALVGAGALFLRRKKKV
jgi:hypothetical protein